MNKPSILLLSFLSAVTVLAQNDMLENINTEIKETIIEPQYNFAPDADSPNVEVAPLAVNAEDQDVPLEPTVSEEVEVNVDSKADENN